MVLVLLVRTNITADNEVESATRGSHAQASNGGLPTRQIGVCEVRPYMLFQVVPQWKGSL